MGGLDSDYSDDDFEDSDVASEIQYKPAVALPKQKEAPAAVQKEDEVAKPTFSSVPQMKVEAPIRKDVPPVTKEKSKQPELILSKKDEAKLSQVSPPKKQDTQRSDLAPLKTSENKPTALAPVKKQGTKLSDASSVKTSSAKPPKRDDPDPKLSKIVRPAKSSEEKDVKRKEASQALPEGVPSTEVASHLNKVDTAVSRLDALMVKEPKEKKKSTPHDHKGAGKEKENQNKNQKQSTNGKVILRPPVIPGVRLSDPSKALDALPLLAIAALDLHSLADAWLSGGGGRGAEKDSGFRFQTDGKGRNALHVACFHGSARTAGVLLRHSGMSLAFMQDELGRTPAFYAAARGHFGLLRLITLFIQIEAEADAGCLFQRLMMGLPRPTPRERAERCRQVGGLQGRFSPFDNGPPRVPMDLADTLRLACFGGITETHAEAALRAFMETLRYGFESVFLEPDKHGLLPLHAAIRNDAQPCSIALEEILRLPSQLHPLMEIRGGTGAPAAGPSGARGTDPRGGILVRDLERKAHARFVQTVGRLSKMVSVEAKGRLESAWADDTREVGMPGHRSACLCLSVSVRLSFACAFAYHTAEAIFVCQERLFTLLLSAPLPFVRSFGGGGAKRERYVQVGVLPCDTVQLVRRMVWFRDLSGFLPLHYAAFSGVPALVSPLLLSGADPNASAVAVSPSSPSGVGKGEEQKEKDKGKETKTEDGGEKSGGTQVDVCGCPALREIAEVVAGGSLSDLRTLYAGGAGRFKERSDQTGASEALSLGVTAVDLAPSTDIRALLLSRGFASRTGGGGKRGKERDASPDPGGGSWKLKEAEGDRMKRGGGVNFKEDQRERAICDALEVCREAAMGSPSSFSANSPAGVLCRTPLHAALLLSALGTSEGHLEGFLRVFGYADPLNPDVNGWTAFHYAAFFGLSGQLARLMSHLRKQRKRSEPLIAESSRMRPSGEPLLPQKTNKGRTALHLAAVRPSNHGCIALLLEVTLLKCGLEDRDGDGLTPLLLAAREGVACSVLQLLQYGADESAKDPEGRGALQLAVMAGREEVVRLLALWNSGLRSREGVGGGGVNRRGGKEDRDLLLGVTMGTGTRHQSLVERMRGALETIWDLCDKGLTEKVVQLIRSGNSTLLTHLINAGGPVEVWSTALQEEEEDTEGQEGGGRTESAVQYLGVMSGESERLKPPSFRRKRPPEIHPEVQGGARGHTLCIATLFACPFIVSASEEKEGSERSEDSDDAGERTHSSSEERVRVLRELLSVEDKKERLALDSTPKSLSAFAHPSRLLLMDLFSAERDEMAIRKACRPFLASSQGEAVYRGQNARIANRKISKVIDLKDRRWDQGERGRGRTS
uniref:Uncharacterized protein n=1 Tax=Chromera velia CCMP2878 TaxID=1169474 RepID=A0A0G4FFP4_9ALVE|eukprot:Cvel_3259.t1-p1 / transcript=Cvel_3259.t1 / gene=Cvel_3259 / organism=Chromera_velia_CCMP2878 / gene_product=Delta-latroinsectotoxin-Lt1a, putative / transcript_product=Delta-latroinsectotoxin-Lt1a, putative / location=Cvel_scaffold128:20192-28590(-) / protein_length=1349 / sequence_SO=supercontig / SO=protein_coding / is_pseudo=false